MDLPSGAGADEDDGLVHEKLLVRVMLLEEGFQLLGAGLGKDREILGRDIGKCRRVFLEKLGVYKLEPELLLGNRHLDDRVMVRFSIVEKAEGGAVHIEQLKVRWLLLLALD